MVAFPRSNEKGKAKVPQSRRQKATECDTFDRFVDLSTVAGEGYMQEYPVMTVALRIWAGGAGAVWNPRFQGDGENGDL
jgi:hypothetical protein